MLPRFPQLALVLALLLGGAACSLKPTLDDTTLPRPTGAIEVALRVAGSPHTQARVKQLTATDIHRVDLIPYWRSQAGEWLPLSKNTGEPTQPTDSEIIKVTMSGEQLDFARTITLTGLRRQQIYRIVGIAYDRDGKLISVPELSFNEVWVQTDDRPHVPSYLIIFMARTPFSGRMPVNLMLEDPDEQADHVEVTLFQTYGMYQVQVGDPMVIPRSELPRVVNLSNLSAKSGYQLVATARPADPAGASLGSSTLEWRMADDDAVATRSMRVSVL